MDSILIIDKPAGPTSHDVVQIVKRLTGAKKVGHLGTLDPAATGVLPLVLNGATKLASRLAGKEKIYEFTLCLGIRTTTDDDEGEVIKECRVDVHERLSSPRKRGSSYAGMTIERGDDKQIELSTERIRETLNSFIGNIAQIPPQYSAIKKNGVKSYRAARKGSQVMLEPRAITIDNIDILSYTPPEIRLKVWCQAGTYIRALARDIGEKLGCGAHARGIRRLKSGNYTIDRAIGLRQLQENPEIWKSHAIAVNSMS